MRKKAYSHPSDFQLVYIEQNEADKTLPNFRSLNYVSVIPSELLKP